MNRQDGSLICEIVRDKKRGGFVVIDKDGKERSAVLESLDFARAALLLTASLEMKQVAEDAFRDGAESQLGVIVENDKAYFSLEPTVIKDI